MASIEVKNWDNKKVGSLELLDEVFGGEINEELLWEAVRQYTAGLRSGTHKTKGRAEVSGSGRKLWRQKGTGRARIGSVRSPVWRHGGTVHGPQPRDYSWSMPEKKLRGALRSALAARYRDSALVVVDSFKVAAPKTKALREALDRFEVRKSALLVDGSAEDHNLELSARNLVDVELLPAYRVHPYHLLRYERVVLSRPALEKLQQAARVPSRRRAAAQSSAAGRRKAKS
jgi:large subunit ribosomal protein L4